jgi:hypothetical protein
MVIGSLEAMQAQTLSPTSPFYSVEVKGSAKVIYQSSNNFSIEIPDSLSTVKWNLEGDKMIIDGSGKKVILNGNNLQRVEVSGSGTFTSGDTLMPESLSADISGSGKIKMSALQAKMVKANISGSGKMILSGKAETLNADISGAGKLVAHDLKANKVKTSISGTGTATVYAEETLNADISGVGKVYYKSTPKQISQQVTGMGKIEPLTDDLEKDFEQKEVVSTPKKAGTYWSGLDIGVNGFYNSKTGFDTPEGYDFLELIPGKSIAVNINFYELDFNIFKNYVIGSTGLGLSYNNFRFRKNINLVPDTNIVTYIPDTMNLRKNKLTISYLTLPFLVTFNTHAEAKKAFHITTGVLLNYKLGSHTKKVYTVDGDKKKDKTYDDFNIDPFKVDGTLRIGYREYTLFANYSLTNLFKKNKGPEMQAWSAGISLVPW